MRTQRGPKEDPERRGSALHGEASPAREGLRGPGGRDDAAHGGEDDREAVRRQAEKPQATAAVRVKSVRLEVEPCEPPQEDAPDYPEPHDPEEEEGDEGQCDELVPEANCAGTRLHTARRQPRDEEGEQQQTYLEGRGAELPAEQRDALYLSGPGPVDQELQRRGAALVKRSFGEEEKRRSDQEAHVQ